MSEYKDETEVPTEVLLKRIEEIVDCITNRRKDLNSELTMTIPVRVDRDADCVLIEVARRLKEKEKLLNLVLMDWYMRASREFRDRVSFEKFKENKFKSVTAKVTLR